MIEKIASINMGEQKADTLFRMPKNIRQIGQINQKKIYIEDYVMTYVRQLGGENHNYGVAILLGRYMKAEESRCLFVSGAIELEEIDFEKNPVFTEEIWNYIYEVKEQYFSSLEVVGWAMMQPGLVLEPSKQIEKIHIDNFAGQDKVLLLYEPIEREESFYLFEGKHLKSQSGYFIYYEKNEVMQNYMLEHKEDRANPEFVEDRATKEIRKLFLQKNVRKVKKQRRNTGFIFASGTVIATTILLLSISANQNNQIFEKVFQNLVQEQKEENGETQTTSVETITADQITIKGENIVGDETDIKNNEIQDDSETQKSEEDETKNKEESKDVMQEETKTIEYYIVKKGDTLASISKEIYKSNSYVDKIKEANAIEDADKIYIGQRLIMPQ